MYVVVSGPPASEKSTLAWVRTVRVRAQHRADGSVLDHAAVVPDPEG